MSEKLEQPFFITYILDDEKEARAYFDQLWAEAMEIYWSTENSYHFNEDAKETLQEKINRMLVTEASRQEM